VTTSRRLAELGISLPPVTAPLGSYVPARRAGHLLHLSGHLAKRDRTVVAGRVGAEIDVETARGLARQVAVDLIATAAEAAGGVDALPAAPSESASCRWAQPSRSRRSSSSGEAAAAFSPPGAERFSTGTKVSSIGKTQGVE